MSRFIAFVALVALCATACSKKDEGGAASTGSGAKDCGADYASPKKEFCVKLPAGYTAGTDGLTDSLVSENIDFKGPKGEFNISVGFSSASYKSFDEAMKSDEDTYFKTPATTVKPQGNGATAGGGKWWAFAMGGSKRVLSDTKSNAGKVISCSGDVDKAPEIIEACKSVRAYPK